MKSIKIWALAMLLATQLTSQNALHDALILKSFCGLANDNGVSRAILKENCLKENEAGDLVLKAEVAAVLAKYLNQNPDQLTQGIINQGFGADVKNPFLRLAFANMGGIEKAERFQGVLSTSPASGNQVSTLVDGIARFLVERTKAELTLAFFDDFKKKVETDIWLQRFFPITRQMLLAIDTEVYQFQIYLDALRDAFIADLKVLPGGLEAYMREASVDFLKPAQQAIAVDLFHVVQGVLDGTPPPTIISYCANSDSSSIQAQVGNLPELQNIAAGLHLVNLFSEAVFNPETGKWYQGSEITKAFSDPTTLNIFMGLLWHKSRSIPVAFKNGVKIETVIGKAAEGAGILNLWKQELSNFGQSGSNWQQSLRNRPSPSMQQTEVVEIPLLDDFYRSLLIFNRLLESVNAVYHLVDEKAEPPIAPDQLQLVQQIGGLSFNISRKHYSAAIANTAQILGICLQDKFTGKNTFLRYGSFIGAMADAKTAEEVQNALDMFALPPGSSRAKKGPGKFSIALNAYTGVSAGVERFKLSTQSYGVSSIAAPIGFSFNWGQNWGDSPGCVGLFFPVIDVGAVFAYRFNDNGVDNLPPMQWKNVIAPGMYFVMDPPVGKLPLTIGLGGQFGPLLRKVGQDGNYQSSEVNAYRIGGFLTCDIPITFFKLRGKN